MTKQFIDIALQCYSGGFEPSTLRLVWPDLAKFRHFGEWSLWKNFDGLFSIWLNFEPTLANFYSTGQMLMLKTAKDWKK